MAEPTSSTGMPVELEGIPNAQVVAPSQGDGSNANEPGAQPSASLTITKEEFDRMGKELNDTKAKVTTLSQEASYWQTLSQQIAPVLNQPSSSNGASDYDFFSDPNKAKEEFRKVAVQTWQELDVVKRQNKFRSDYDTFRRGNPQEASELHNYVQRAYQSKSPWEINALEFNENAVQKLIDEAKELRKQDRKKLADEILAEIAGQVSNQNANSPQLAAAVAASTNFGKPSGGPPSNQPSEGAWWDDIARSGPKSTL